MSKYFGWIDGEAYDFRYKPLGDGMFTNIYLGEHLICRTAKDQRGNFCSIVQARYEEIKGPMLVGGFATRWDAIQYALKVHPLTAKSYNRVNHGTL